MAGSKASKAAADSYPTYNSGVGMITITKQSEISYRQLPGKYGGGPRGASRGAQGQASLVSDPLMVPVDLTPAAQAAANAASAAVTAANAADEHLGRGLELETVGPTASGPTNGLASGGGGAGGAGAGAGAEGGPTTSGGELGEESLVLSELRQSTETLFTDIALLDSAAALLQERDVGEKLVLAASRRREAALELELALLVEGHISLREQLGGLRVAHHVSEDDRALAVRGGGSRIT